MERCNRNGSVVRDERFNDELMRSPVFVKGEIAGVREMIRDRVSTGTRHDLLQKIDDSPVRPSKQLAEAAGSMLSGNEEFVLLDEQKTVLELIVATATRALVESKQILIIKGGPGTGK